MRPWREVLISRTAVLARLTAPFLASLVKNFLEPLVKKESFQRA